MSHQHAPGLDGDCADGNQSAGRQADGIGFARGVLGVTYKYVPVQERRAHSLGVVGGEVYAGKEEVVKARSLPPGMLRSDTTSAKSTV